MRQSGRLNLEVRSLEPLHHGQGAIGNTQVLRTQRVYSPDVDRLVRLPYVSGNSIKHQLRVGMVKFALGVLEVEDFSMTKPMVHLLFSGGSLGKKGSSVKLDKARKLESLFPPLSICGYSAANIMPPSKLKVDHLHLVCFENRWRMPDEVMGKPEAGRRMAEFRSEEFGTRHEPTRMDNYVNNLLCIDDAEKDIESATKAANSKTSVKQSGSAQMLYEFEVIASGALWWGGLYFDDLTEMELMALTSGIHCSSRGQVNDGLVFMIGAKSSIGYGRSSVKVSGFDLATDLDPYVSHLTDNKSNILSCLREVA